MWISKVFAETFVKKVILSPLNCFGTSVESQLTINIWVYFCTLNLIPFTYTSILSQYHTDFVTRSPAPASCVSVSQKWILNSRERKQARVYSRSLVYKGANKKRNLPLQRGMCKAYKGTFPKGEPLGLGKCSSVPRSLSCGCYFLVDTRQSQDAFVHDQHSLRLLKNKNTYASRL